MAFPNYNMLKVILWYPIAAAEVPFSTFRAVSSLPPGNGALVGYNAYYNDPRYAGIYITSNGLSGANERWMVTVTEAFVGKKIKLYEKYGNNWYVHELQAWGPGFWIMQNPSSGPAVPNQVIFGIPVDIFDDFEPNERDPNFPPPTYSPFEPIVNIQPEGEGPCRIMERVMVSLGEPANLTILQVLVYRDGVLYNVSLADLLNGFLFTEAGEYEMVIYYSYMGNPTQTLTEFFIILRDPYSYVQVEKTFGSVIFSHSPVAFDHILATNGSIELNRLNGQITFHFCGVFFIKWFVVPEMGLSKDGANFAVASDSTDGEQGSSHVCVSPAAGFTIMEIDAVPATVRLVNTSDNEIVLSHVTKVSAGLVIAKIDDVDAAEETNAGFARKN